MAPTYASLLTRLFSGSPEERESVLAHLEASGADRAAAEPEVRARLRDSFPWLRLVAAEAVLRVYRDTPAAVDALAGVVRGGEPGVVADAADVIRTLGADAVPLLVLMVRHAPDVFAAQTTDFHLWAAEAAARNGPDGLAAWLELLGPGHVETDTALLIGLARAAPAAAHDLTPAEPALRANLTRPNPDLKAAAGAALWRVTWRVNRDWLAWLDPGGFRTKFPGLRELLFDVLVEHLGRKPAVAALVRNALADLADADPDAGAKVVEKLARLGSRGWGVLVPALGVPKAGPGALPVGVRAAIFRHAADRPAVLPLVHHHAHAAIAAAAAEGSTNDLVPHAARVLSQLGPAAGTAVPDLLNLAARVPHTGLLVGATVARVAAGFPNAPAAIVRTLGRLRCAPFFGAEHLAAFEALAWALAKLDPDAAPALVGSTEIDPRVPDALLQHPGWKDAPASVRDRHARVLADALASPRPEVRLRAAELLRHYREELPAVWPPLAAALAGADEKVAVAVLPHFRHLGPVADAVSADLCVLFRDKKSAYAARAAVALWRLGRLSDVGAELRAAVEAGAGDGWGWAVLAGVADRAGRAHGLLADLAGLFADSPPAVAEKVFALVNPPELPPDADLSRLVPRPGDATAPAAVNWNGLRDAVEGEGVPGALFGLALMCEYGSEGSHGHKIWMIKNCRELTRLGLTESKRVAEQVMEVLARPGAAAGDRRQAVREFFAGRTELPPEIVGMLEHRLGWFRWAGLELADAWGLTPGQARQLTEDRVRDANPRVRERALRMVRA